MATLSFQCPSCNKTHDRIRPEMAGFKVKCQCGFVFRLGPKSTQNKAAFDATIQARKTAKSKQRGAAPRSKPVGPRSKSASSPFDGDFFDAIPAAPNPGAGESLLPSQLDDQDPLSSLEEASFADAEFLDAEPLDDLLPLDEPSLLDEPMTATSLDSAYPPPAAWSSPRPTLPTKKTSRKARPARKRSGPFQPGGAVWTLILAVMGMGMMVFLNVIYGLGTLGAIAANAEGFHVLKLAAAAISGLAFLLSLATTILLVTAGILAIIELSQQQYKTWAIQWAGRTAAMLVALMLLNFAIGAVLAVFHLGSSDDIVYQSGGQALAVQKEGLALALVISFVFVCLFSAVPVAIAITGFMRRGQ